MKTPQTNEELKKHLQDQLGFLKASCELYDQGNHAEGKRIALALRLLLHDTTNSISLAQQLGIKNQNFLSTCCQLFDDQNVAISQKGLISAFMGADPSEFYIPLDQATDKNELEFNDWWNEIVLIDQERNKFSRKDLVLTIANQDGGAHIDPNLESKYAQLSRKNSLGMMTQKDGHWEAIKTPELATVRQIGHEVLKTLIKDYEKQPTNRGNGIIVGNVNFEFSTSQTAKPHKKVGRNDHCPCGSGKKYKKCCGK